MLETYFSAPKMLGHLRSGPSGPHLDGFAALLERGGYSPATAVRYLRAAAHLGHFLHEQGGTLTEIDLTTFAEHLRSCRCPRSKGGRRNHHTSFGAKHFRDFLMAIGACRSVAGRPVAQHAEPEVIAGFRVWLRKHRGAAAPTIRLYTNPRAGRACELFVHLPAYELPGVPGDEPEIWVLMPEGFDPKTRVYAGLVAELERDLSHHSVLDCRRRTLAPRRVIEAIAERQPERQWQAMAADDVEVHYIALDEVNLKEKGAADRPALHVVGRNFDLGISFSLALIEVKNGHKKKVVARLARLLLKLPRPEALIAMVTDYGKQERKVLAEALRLATARCSALAPYLLLDRYHILQVFVEPMNQFRIDSWKAIERGKNGKKLKNLSWRQKQKVKHIKGAHCALTTTRWSQLLEDEAAMEKLRRAFKAAPELKKAFWVLENLRQIFDCRSLAAAEARYKAWKQQLKESGLTCFDQPARHLQRQWKDVRVYFQVLEILDARFEKGLKIGSNPVEGHNRESKAVWRYARRSSIKRIEQRLLTRKGYIVESQGAQLPRKPRRQYKPKKTS